MGRPKKYVTEEQQKTAAYLKNKKKLAGRRGIECFLTYGNILTLLDEAGITIWQIGRSRDEYHLARHGDTGPYAMGNCRFITALENQAERKYTWSTETRKTHEDYWTAETRKRHGEMTKKRAPPAPKHYCSRCEIRIEAFPSNRRAAPKHCKPCAKQVKQERMTGNQHAAK